MRAGRASASVSGGRPVRAAALVSAVVVASGVGFALWQLHPELVVSDTTPTGGDLGAHVWGPAYLRDHLLPDLRLSGWSFDWFGGFPAYRFYMVLPALLVVLVDVVVPYGVALKLVSMLGLLALPVAAWAFGRLGGARYPVPPLLAMAAVVFLFDETFAIYGGNIASAMAGEFSFSIALSLALVYLGLLADLLRSGRRPVLTAVVFALAALCHGIVAAAMLPVGTAVVAAVYTRRERWRRNAAQVALVVGVGSLLSAFWVLPFLLDRRLMTDMGYPRRPFGPDDSYWQMLFPQAAWIDGILLALALAGLLGSVVRRRRLGTALAAMTLVFGAWACLQPASLLWNARLLPFFYLGRYLLAAIGFVELVALARHVLGRRAPRRRRPAGGHLAAAAGTLAVLFLLLLQLQELPGGRVTLRVTAEDGQIVARHTYRWGPLSYAFDGDDPRGMVDDAAAWAYGGYEARQAHAEYAGLVDRMAQLGERRGCGRAMWEDHAELARYGTPFALMLLPHWTGGCIGSLEGLYFESSATTPYIYLTLASLSAQSPDPIPGLPYRHADLATGVEQARLLGVRYYLARSAAMISQAERYPELARVASSGGWRVYEIAGGDRLVTPLTHEPVVAGPRDDWRRLAVEFFQHPSRYDEPLVADGPAAWRRATPTSPPPRPLPPVDVTDVTLGDDSMSFHVDRTGVPVLVKVSYHPNWGVAGADRPYRIAPNLMVVVPTENDVQLHYRRSRIDILASALSIGGLLAALALRRSPRAGSWRATREIR